MTRPNVLTRLSQTVGRWAESLFTTPRLVHLFGREPIRLRYVGRRSGRTIELPVWAKRTPTGLLVQVGRPGKKTWWRNFRIQAPVSVCLDGVWRDADGQVTEPKPGQVEVVLTWRQAS